MKNFLLVLTIFFSGTSFAQNMANTESYGESHSASDIYIGKCMTHPDYQSRYYTTTKHIQKFIESDSISDAKKLANKVGMGAFLIMAKEYFGFNDARTKEELIASFAEYNNDITVDEITMKATEKKMIRFNVGFGGGNGGFLVVAKTEDGYKKISKTRDGSLDYCDKSVWK